MKTVQPAARESAPQLLFVDADIVARSVIANYLRECGYAVVEATSTDEAKALLARPDLDIDIVFADVDAPGEVDGFGLARWTAEHFPRVRVILSATLQREAKIAADLCGEGPLLRKPYDQAALLDQIRRLR
ncbi:MAG TPA: response regulator [Tahibacter sp.]|nr:response regulator [Tahibacter sp.]